MDGAQLGRSSGLGAAGSSGLGRVPVVGQLRLGHRCRAPNAARTGDFCGTAEAAAQKAYVILSAAFCFGGKVVRPSEIQAVEDQTSFREGDSDKTLG